VPRLLSEAPYFDPFVCRIPPAPPVSKSSALSWIEERSCVKSRVQKNQETLFYTVVSLESLDATPSARH